MQVAGCLEAPEIGFTHLQPLSSIDEKIPRSFVFVIAATDNHCNLDSVP